MEQPMSNASYLDSHPLPHVQSPQFLRQTALVWVKGSVEC